MKTGNLSILTDATFVTLVILFSFKHLYIKIAYYVCFISNAFMSLSYIYIFNIVKYVTISP